MLKFIDNWLPVWVTFQKDLPVRGRAKWFWVRINPKYKEDPTIYGHEYVHVRQFYFLQLFPAIIFSVGAVNWPPLMAGLFIPILHAILRRKSKRYHLWLEASAKAVEVNMVPPDKKEQRFNLELRSLTQNYGLESLGEETIEKALRRAVD